MHYVVIATLRLPAGSVVGLSDAQAAARAHALEAVPKRKGWFTATGELCFKVGEALQHEGELPKALANAVEAPKRDGKPGKPVGDKQPPVVGKSDDVDAAGQESGAAT